MNAVQTLCYLDPRCKEKKYSVKEGDRARKQSKWKVWQVWVQEAQAQWQGLQVILLLWHEPRDIAFPNQVIWSIWKWLSLNLSYLKCSTLHKNNELFIGQGKIEKVRTLNWSINYSCNFRSHDFELRGE